MGRAASCRLQRAAGGGNHLPLGPPVLSRSCTQCGALLWGIGCAVYARRSGPHTILGIHYFGDFQIEYGYGHLLRTGLSPYLGSYIHDDQSPLSAALFSVLSFVRLTRAAFVYFVITIAGILVPTWFLLRPWRATRRVMFLSIVGLLSLGSIATLDRGNDLGITFGLIALSCLGWKMERFWICGAALALAIAFKGYPAALLIVPLGLRRYRFASPSLHRPLWPISLFSSSFPVDMSATSET